MFEHYWRGTNFDTVADAQAFTRLLPALAIGVAVSHRLIGWPDEPVGTFISEWHGDARGAITVRNLLQSASGLAGPAALPPDTPLRPRAARAAPERAARHPALDQPADPQLLALVLERASKERFAAYVSRVLWRRIGAADAWLWLDQPGRQRPRRLLPAGAAGRLDPRRGAAAERRQLPRLGAHAAGLGDADALAEQG